MMNFTRLIVGLFLSVTAMTLYANNDSNAQPKVSSSANTTLNMHNSQIVKTDKSTSTLTIAVLGDSLSAGYGIKAQEGWVALLSQKLQQEEIKAAVINGSVSGATTDAGLSMQAGLIARAPDIMIIELGANDGLQGKPLGLIEHNLSTLITNAQKADAKVLLLGVHLPPNLGKRYTQPFFAQYAKLAKQHNTALVPFFLEGVAGKPEYMQNDGLHPNAKAQLIILNNIWPSLQPLIAQALTPQL